MIRRVAVGAAVAALPAAAGVLLRRATTRLLEAPRVGEDEAGLGPELDALGGEVVRLRSRDGLRLSARWLPAAAGAMGDDGWSPDPREAIVLLHGWSGSVAPDMVEFGPLLRRTANVLGLDFRGHGESDDSPTTFGLREVEDVAGALAWLGERGIRRVALFGTSMGGITALAAVVVLGEGTLVAADNDPSAPMSPAPAPRPQIVGVAVESVPPDLPGAVAERIGGPFRRLVAARLFASAARRLGGDPRETEPRRVIGLVEIPLLLIHGTADETVRLSDGRRLAALAGPGAEHWEVEGAQHSRAHAADPAAYESRVSTFLRRCLAAARPAAARPAAAPPAVADAEGPAAILPATPRKPRAPRQRRRPVND